MRFRLETKHEEEPYSKNGDGETTVYLTGLTFEENNRVREAVEKAVEATQHDILEERDASA